MSLDQQCQSLTEVEYCVNHARVSVITSDTLSVCVCKCAVTGGQTNESQRLFPRIRSVPGLYVCLSVSLSLSVCLPACMSMSLSFTRPMLALGL